MRIQSLSGLKAIDLAARRHHARLAVENHRRQHQDRRIHEERDRQRGDGVNGVEANRAADGALVLLQLPALHQRRMQIKIVRHHRRPDDADGHVNHPRLAKTRAHQRAPHLHKIRLGLRQHEKSRGNNRRRWSRPAAARRLRSSACRSRCKASSSRTSSPVMITAHSSGMWNIRLSATALPSTSARSHAPMASSQNSQFGQRVQRGIPVAAALRQVFSGDHAQPRGNDLHENRHQAGQPDHPQQAVFELRAARQVGAPVARDPCIRR